MSRETLVSLLELMVPAAPLLLLFFKSVREWLHRLYKRLRPHSMEDISNKLDRVLHEVLPNNGGSMRDEMRRAFEMVKTTLSSSTEGQLELDSEGNLIWANEPFTRWTGRSVAQLQGRGFLTTILDADQGPFQIRLENAVKHQLEFTQDCRMRGVDANDFVHGGFAIFNAEWRLIVVRDPKTGVRIGYSGSVCRVRADHPNAAMPGRAVYQDDGA